jgi:hypothetical protein
LLRLISFGVFLLILGIVTLATPNLSDQIGAFGQDLKLEQIHPSVNVSFPVPQGPHPQLYDVGALFGLAFGAYLILLLIAKSVLGADLNQKAETLTGVIFWGRYRPSYARTCTRNPCMVPIHCHRRYVDRDHNPREKRGVLD